MSNISKEDKRHAFLYCRLRDEQYALYGNFAKRNGMLMKTFLILNALYYAKTGLTQKALCKKTFNSKQTVNLIIKNLQKQNYIQLTEDFTDKRNKRITLTAAGRIYAEKPVRHITWAEDMAMSMLTSQEQELLIALSLRFTQNLTKLVTGKADE